MFVDEIAQRPLKLRQEPFDKLRTGLCRPSRACVKYGVNEFYKHDTPSELKTLMRLSANTV